MLRVLTAAWPNQVSKDAIDTATGYKRSSRDAYLQRLRARQLIMDGPDGVYASSLLFDW